MQSRKIVAEQRVTGLELLGCVAGEKIETENQNQSCRLYLEVATDFVSIWGSGLPDVHGLHGVWRYVCVG